jgi:hypothetical protein
MSVLTEEMIMYDVDKMTKEDFVYKIEKNISVWARVKTVHNHESRELKYPFILMEVGDSFAVPTLDPCSSTHIISRDRVFTALRNWQRNHSIMKEWRFVSRLSDDATHHRWWRVA